MRKFIIIPKTRLKAHYKTVAIKKPYWYNLLEDAMGQRVSVLIRTALLKLVGLLSLHDEGYMCKQVDVLKKIRKKGRVNGYDVELAEAQCEDFMEMAKRITSIEKKLSEVDTKLAVQDGKLDLILQRLDGGVDTMSKEGLVWHEIKGWVSSWKFWALLILFLCCVALAGEKILSILSWIPTGA